MTVDRGRTALGKRLGRLAPGNLPGGRDGRRMLWVALVDRVGSGLWASTSVLYFTFVTRLTVGEIGALAAAAGLAGLVGPPVGGRLADRLPLTRVLIAFQLLRAVAAAGLLVTDGLVPLLALSAAGGFGDRAASVLTKLYASRVAGAERVRYQAVNRTVANAGWTVGGLGAAAVLAVGGETVYRVLLLGDALSFVAAALLTARCADVSAGTRVVTGGAEGEEGGEGGEEAERARPTGPWRDRTYLLYVLTDALLFLDDAVFRVGLPLWAVHATDAPHGAVPLLLVLNSAMVVGLQVPLARFGATTRAAHALLLPLSVVFTVSGVAMAASAVHGAVAAAVCLTVAAAGFTLAEMLHAIVSWELSIALAPDHAQGTYLGVHGLAQASQRAAGPLAVTAAIAAGPFGWGVFGVIIAGGSLAQHRLVRGRLPRAAEPAETEKGKAVVEQAPESVQRS
ncbi:MFS transporter [Streptomyces sp. I05A-00742]|uniref:MFS transporter n=1 Tax=Streptomyces sp. I05A-00742 TaxID=2732853 RepID=UPI0028A2AED6|nr:MFS transporter [Streptomyces sp. I05A-00742]